MNPKRDVTGEQEGVMGLTEAAPQYFVCYKKAEPAWGLAPWHIKK